MNACNEASNTKRARPRRGTTPQEQEQLAQLRGALVADLGCDVEVVATHNRRSMIRFHWSRQGLSLRVHRIFLEADADIWRAVIGFCRHPGKANRAVIDQYIAAHQQQIGRETARTRTIYLDTEGEHYDLCELFDGLNRKHFKRQCDARVTWGKAAGKRKKTRGIQLGSYDPEANLIRLNRALDHGWVPRYVIDSMLYHEMLHWLFRPRAAGARRVVHGKAFREAERAHPYFEKSQAWVAKNLDRLLND